MNDVYTPARAPSPTPPRFEDEIDLIDLGLALWRRRLLVLGFLLAGVLIGVALSLVPRDDHRISAVLTLGKISNGAEPQRVESTETVADWLNNSLLPAAIQKVAADAGVPPDRFDLSARNGKGNGLVIEGNSGQPLISAHVEAIEWAAAGSRRSRINRFANANPSSRPTSATWNSSSSG
jgi:hypothetical protein